MRFFLAGAYALAALTAPPAFALDTGDTMQAWAGASSADKDDVLRKLGTMAAAGSVRSCLDDTAKAAGHASLPIAQVAKACSDQASRDNI